MIVASSAETLWAQIKKYAIAIQDEAKWLEYYATQPYDEACVEDCTTIIMETCKAVLENLEDLRSDEV